MTKNINIRWQYLLFSCISAALLFGLWRLYQTNSSNVPALPARVEAEQLIVGQDQVSVFPAKYKGYLANPGMGWQSDLSSDLSYFPETVQYANRTDVAWKNLNPAEGVYNWISLDDQFARAKAAGRQFSFRVFTMSGESYGGHQVPEWVLEKGAVILSSGEPDYSNCAYQEHWGQFVNALLERYDGDRKVAFIDISGYGNFNEWSWQNQTTWDALWEKSYEQGNASSSSLRELDGQARRRLVDMFIGGAYKSHQCRDINGNTQSVDYSYTGAQKTQLVMPFAGIVQSTQYVFTRSRDVGFRFDCLGRDDPLPLEEISQIWRAAPIVYEFCGPGNFDFTEAKKIIEKTHPVIIHNNDYHGDMNELQQLIDPVGYRFFLNEAITNSSVNAGGQLTVSMLWQNLGASPIYLKMGQTPRLYLHFLDRANNQITLNALVDVNFSTWLPADPFSSSNSPTYKVDALIPIPESMPRGVYTLLVSIIDEDTGLPLQLAMEGMDASGRFSLFDINVK